MGKRGAPACTSVPLLPAVLLLLPVPQLKVKQGKRDEWMHCTVEFSLFQ